MATRMRWFKRTYGGITELHEDEPAQTDNLFKEIKQNMDKLFPDLVVLEDKFVKTDYRPDMVAFDRKRGMFVVIEYKVKKNDVVFDQILSYLKRMETDKNTLVDAYCWQMDYDRSKFDWGGAYGIVMSPEFTNLQKISARINRSLELHKASAYENEIISLTEVVVPKERSKSDAAKDTEGAVIEPGPGDVLYRGARDWICKELKLRAEETSKNNYRELRDPDGTHICTAYVRKQHIWIAYQGKRKKITTGDDFWNLLPGLTEHYRVKKRGPRYIG